MPQPAAVLQLSDALRRAYDEAWRRVLAEEQRLIDDPRQFRRVRRLKAMQQRILDDMDQLDAIARLWLRDSYPRVYESGAVAMSAELGQFFEWSQSHRQAIAAIASDTFDDLLAATNGVRKSTKRLIRSLAREETLAKMIEGKTPAQSSRDLRRVIERRGIYSVRYRDGSRHGISEYADIVIRTKSAVGYNAGGLNVAAANGVKFMEVFDGIGCGWTAHGDVDTANGTVRSLAECRATPISHPRCRRSFGPRPDVTTKREARTQSALGRQRVAAVEALSRR